MRAWVLGGVLLLIGASASAQNGSYIRYYPPASSGNLGSSPGQGFLVDTDGSGTLANRTLTNTDGCITVSNGDGVAANPTVNIDTTCVLTFSSGTGTAPATGALGTLYIETDTGIPTLYTNTDTIADLVTEQQDSIAGADWFIDEDSFATDSATRVPSQQSVKAYVDASGSSFDPGTTLELYEEFASGATTTGNLGNAGTGFTAVATGTVSPTVAGTAGNPGLLRLNSHATNDNSGAIVGFQNNVSTAFNSGTWDAEDWSVDAVVIYGSNSTAITNTALYVGLSNSMTTLPSGTSAGIWIRHDTDDTDATFIFATCDSATTGCDEAGDNTNQRVAASTVTPSAGTAYRFRIRRAQSGVGGNPTIYFRVNNESEVTFCSSGCTETYAEVPSANLNFIVAYVTRTTTGVLSSDLDYMYLRIPGLARY